MGAGVASGGAASATVAADVSGAPAEIKDEKITPRICDSAVD
jgi:hypothetical protein